MTVVVIGGVLTLIVGLLILLPFSVTDGRLRIRAGAPDDAHGRELLRQLRDLDDDLATGKLTPGDHALLRDPVERQAAGVLQRTTRSVAAGTGAVASSTQSRSTISVPPRGRGGDWLATRWGRRPAMLLAIGVAAACVTILLIGAVSSRHPGQTITGNSVAGGTSLAGSADRSGLANHGGRSPTPGQLAAVAAAQAEVKQSPKNVSAHLALADAYAAAGAGQLAAVEYLAVIRLDPANAEANTNLALLAFEVGQAAQGKVMVDRVLAAHPNYPEALYVRGLIYLIGLRLPADAAHDFNAYLAVAPFGSHRAAAVTLLALAESQTHR